MVELDIHSHYSVLRKNGALPHKNKLLPADCEDVHHYLRLLLYVVSVTNDVQLSDINDVVARQLAGFQDISRLATSPRARHSLIQAKHSHSIGRAASA